MVDLLVEQGANIEAQTDLRRTPFYVAVLNGNVETARRLKELGCRVKVADVEGVLPEFWARVHKHRELEELCAM